MSCTLWQVNDIGEALSGTCTPGISVTSALLATRSVAGAAEELSKYVFFCGG